MHPMTDTRPPLRPTLPRPGLAALLLFDAATCAALGLLMLAATQALALLLGLPGGLLTGAGVLLLACAVPMLVAARQRPPAAALVLLVVLGNLAWVLACLYVAWALDGLTALGRGVVLAQGVAVLALAILEWRGLAAQRHPGASARR